MVFTVKFIILLLICMDTSLLYDFTTLYIGHLENIGLPSYANIPNIDTFHFILTKKKITFETKKLVSSEKSFRYWEAVMCMVTDASFPKFKFLLESSSFTIGNKTVICLTWSDSSLCSFWKNKCLWNTQDCITIVGLSVFLSLEMVFRGKSS